VTLYLDSSALLRVYLAEADADRFEELLLADTGWASVRVTQVEVRRNLARRLAPADRAPAAQQFAADWARTAVVEMDRTTCALAADLAEVTGARSLDALHLAAAQRLGGGALTFVTADIRQAQVARSLGLAVAGS